MRQRKILKELLLLAVMLAAAALCSGCMLQTVDQLYCVPKRSEDFNALQTQLTKVLGSVDYCAPVSGDNQQAVQLADLDGDGVDEALLFARGVDDRPMKIYVFQEKDGIFENIALIESAGTSFDQVEYAQIDGSSGMELVVGRRVSDDLLRALSVYTFRNGQAELLLSAVYTNFLTTDLDTNGLREVLILRPGTGENGVAELYEYGDNAMELSGEAGMSAPVDALKRIASGGMCESVPAVFAAMMTADNQLLTDVFALVNGRLKNTSLSSETGTSVQTIRNYVVYASDVDNDGLVELPRLLKMPMADENNQPSGRYLIKWYNLQLDGTEVDKLLTYHNYVDGWFVQLPDSWRDSVVIYRNSDKVNEISYDFCSWAEGETFDPVFSIYLFTGDDRRDQANEAGRFYLGESGDFIFSGYLSETAAQEGFTREMIQSAFHLIRTDWKTGET